MIQKFVLTAIGALSFTLLTAQIASVGYDTTRYPPPAPEEEKKEPALTISGSMDAYYKYDVSKSTANSLTSFTQTHNAFSLGMASLKFEYGTGEVTGVADLGFGPRARDFAYADEGITQAIKQLYVSYAPADWIRFTAGTWATHVGYELLDPQYNRNYSMSYMFTNGPFSHTGLKAELSTGRHGGMIGIANATDYRIPPDGFINKKFLLAQYSYAASDNLKFFLNYAGGQNPDTSKSSQFDAVITATVSDKFSMGYNGTVSSTKAWDGAKNLDSKSWWGSALYLNFDPQPWLGLTLRGEYFNDKNQLKAFSGAMEGGHIFSTTLSANFKTGGLIIIPEIRVDNASNDYLFVDSDGASARTATSFILAAIYSF